jgi:hypothetical protein
VISITINHILILMPIVFVIGGVVGSWITLMRWRVQDARDKRVLREVERRVKVNHSAYWRARLKMRGIIR